MSTPLHVLLLEDRPADAELMLHALRQVGFDPDWQRVETEADYLAHLDPQPDIILADYTLPQFDVMRALHLLRERSLDIPLIVVTGSIGEEVAVECIKQGAADYLLKDRLARLGEAVRSVLEGKRLRDERWRAEQALMQSEEQYRTLAESSLTGVYLIQGRLFRYVNPALALIFGYSVDEIIGKLGPLDLTAAEDRSMVAENIRQRMEGKVHDLHYTFRGLHKDGRLIDVEAHGASIDYEGKSAVIGTLLDITERKQAEEQARRRAEQIAAINLLGRTLSETLDLDQIYERFYQAIVSLLPDSRTIFISLFDNGQAVLRCAFAMSEGERINITELPPMPLEPPGVGTQSEAVHTRRPVIVNDLQARLKRVRNSVDVGDDSGRQAQSGLYIPMLARERVIGVLQTQSLLPDRYTEFDAELLSLVANTAAVAIENARLYAEAWRRLNHVQALREIDRVIAGSMNIQLAFEIVLKHVLVELGVDAAVILLYDPNEKRLTYALGKGLRTAALQYTRLRLGDGYAGRAALARQTVYIPNLQTRTTDFLRSPTFFQEGFVCYFGVPLVARGEIKGVLEIFHRAPLNQDKEWLDFMETLAGQIAIAIDNATLYRGLQHSNIELALAYDATIEGWSKALDLRDKETEGHTQRVTDLTELLARAMGFNDPELVHIRRGGLLHDIGKMGVPDSILLKPDTLTGEEWEIMHKHPQFAYDMLSPIAYLRPALEIPYCHHEKWDGTGYPRRLKGEEIPLAARIFAVADVYDALTSDRPYRKAWSVEKTLEYIREQSGKHFDPQVVDVFLKVRNETRA